MVAPLVSVVLPVYNSELYLRHAIRSVLEQEFDQDLELILIDDGSTDGSLEIARDFARSDRRVNIISRENRGLVSSVNEGISAANGEWIARMDADDICVPERLARQIAWARAMKAEVCGGFIRTFGHTFPRVRKYPVSDASIRLKLLFNSCFAHPTVIGRREVLSKFPYYASFQPGDDYELWTRLAIAGISLTNCPAVVLNYRLHGQQMTTTRRSEFDHMSAKIAGNYRKACFPALSESPHANILSRQAHLMDWQVVETVEWFKYLFTTTEDLEGVILDNAFIFLARHAEIGPLLMTRLANSVGIPRVKILLLCLLALTGSDQKSMAFNFLQKLR